MLKRKGNCMKTRAKATQKRMQNRKAIPASLAPKNVASRRPQKGALKLTSILVPTDFSTSSKKALLYAVALARKFGAKLTLLHIVEPAATPDFALAFPLAIENDRVTLECKRQLQRIAREENLDPELVEKILVRQGRAYDEITSAAKSLKVDLIVISTHGYTGLKHVFMGSTTERVVRHASCPVLVVRAMEHEFVAS